MATCWLNSDRPTAVSNFYAWPKKRLKASFFMTKFSYHILLIVLTVVTVALVYSPALGNGLVWDDPLYLRGRPEYWVPDLWKKAIFEPFFVSVNYFRPLVICSFLADNYFFSGSEFGYHLTNYLIHLAAVIVFYLVSKELFSRSGVNLWWSSFAALFYGLSPILSEVVVWVSGRFDLLFSFFLLLLLYVDLKFHGKTRIVLVATCYFMAACSKEMAAAFGLVYPFWRLYIARLEDNTSTVIDVWRGKDCVYGFLSILFSGILYLALRYYALGYVYLSDPLSGVGVPGSGFLYFLKTVGGYVSVIIGFASNISPVYPISADWDSVDMQVVLGLAVLISAICFALIRSQLGIILIAFLLALLPVSNVFPLNVSGNYMHLRFVSFPYALLILMLFPVTLSLMNIFPKFVGAFKILVLGFLVIGAVVIRSVIPVWQNNHSLWTWVLDRYPDYRLAQVNLLVDRVTMGDYYLALEMGRNLIRADLSSAYKIFVYEALAECYFKMNQKDKMIEQYEHIFANYSFGQLKNGHFAKIYAKLANALFHFNPNDEQVQALLAESLKLDEAQDLAWFVRALISYKRGDVQDAVVEFQTAFKFMEDGRRAKNIEYLKDRGIWNDLIGNGVSTGDITDMSGF